ncbi:hypothetical protein JCM10908_003741 [Rhodotorula pacifica]|uniref:uncharacterized protein n=1 Tax=Rhodotorula pacifica TaxID=1495444 RepID=UPI00317239B8
MQKLTCLPPLQQADVELPPRDQFSNLPTELLTKIFDDAWAERRPSGALSRALCPFYDRYAWRSIRLDSAARLAQFFNMNYARPGLGLLCEALTVRLEPDELDAATLAALLRLVPNLKELVLGDLASAAFDRVLDSTKTAFLPAHLHKLALSCSTGTRKDPYHPTNWSVLAQLANLKHLALDLRSAETPVGRIKSKKEMLSWPLIDNLEVDLPQKGRSSVLQLIESFPNLSRLRLSSTSPVADFVGALKAVQNPVSLETLVLDGSPKKGWALPVEELGQLTNLRLLGLVGDWHHLAAADIQQICDLPLHHFELGAKSEFPLSPFFESLQTGRLPNLETLRFDNLTCKVGYDDRDDDDFPWGWEEQIEVISDCMRTWRRAKWTKHFTRTTFQSLVNLCEGRKIGIEGSLSRALFVDKQLDSMQRAINILKGRILDRGTGINRGINGGGYCDYDDHGHYYRRDYGWR